MKPKKPNRWFVPPIRSWLRFSLRTLMIITVLAAFAVRWWMRPELTVYRQPDGATVKYTLIRPIDPASKTQLEPRRHGRYELRDKSGRLSVRGQYENGLPVGMWNVFHPNGRRAIRGRTVSGERSGEWNAWNENGSLISTATYQIPATPRPMSAGKFTAPWYATRVGVGESCDEHGHLGRGKFVNDLQDGEWVVTDSNERIVRRSEYRLGVRHGRTLEVDANGATHETYYLHGHPLPPLTELLPRLERDLQADDGGRQFEALRTVVQLGAPAETLLLPILAGKDGSLPIFAMRLLSQELRSSDNVLRQVEQLTHSSQHSVAIEAWFTLYQLAPARQIEIAHQIVDFAAGSELPVRYTIGYRLGRQAGPIPEALDRALDSDNPTIRRVALETLTVMLFTPHLDDEKKSQDTQLDKLMTKARSSADPSISAAAAQLDRDRKQS